MFGRRHVDLASRESLQPPVVVVLARCGGQKKLYGIRLEKSEDAWVGTWAFAIQEERASREGYSQNEIRGQIGLGDGYPGCPYCGHASIYKCECGKVVCYDGKSRLVTCPWCRRRAIISGTADSLSVGTDR